MSAMSLTRYVAADAAQNAAVAMAAASNAAGWRTTPVTIGETSTSEFLTHWWGRTASQPARGEKRCRAGRGFGSVARADQAIGG